MSTSGILSSSLFASSPIFQFLNEFQQLGQDLKSGNLPAAQQDFVTLSQDVQGPSSGTSGTSSTGSTASPSAPQSNVSTLAAEFQTLGQDLQSGDLKGAQQAFQQIQQSLTGGGGEFHVHGHGHGGHHGRGSALSQLTEFLQSIFGGNSSSSTTSPASTNAATSAATSSTGSGSTASGSTASSTGTSSSASSTSSASSSSASSGSTSSGQSAPVTLDTLKQDFSAIGSALLSGSLSSAQQAYAQLTQDVSSFASSTGSQSAPTQSPSSGGNNAGISYFSFDFVSSSGSGVEMVQGFLQSSNLSSSPNGANPAAPSGSTLNVTA